MGKEVDIFFTNIVWILDTICNLDCLHCYVHERNWSQKISKERALKIIEEAKKCGFKSIDFTGGEPFLLKDVFEYIERARELKLETSINSNGLLLNRDIVKFLRNNDVYLYLSIDGSKKEIYEQIRVKGSFEKLIENIYLLNKFDLPFSVIFSISTLNCFDAKNMVKFAKNIGSQTLFLIPVIPTGKAKKTKVYVDSSLIIETIKDVSEEADKEKFHVTVWCSPFLRNFDFSDYVNIEECHIFDFIDLAPNGDILMCDVIDIPLSQARTKSLYEALMEIENNPIYQELKERSKSCVSCNVVDFCKGGCYARSYLLEGSLKKPDPFCSKILTFSKS